MIISGKNICKGFGNNNVINHISFLIDKNTPCAILGKNGAGKSTLLKIIAGIEKQDAGELIISDIQNAVPKEIHFSYISLVAPYMELIEDFSLQEKIEFHAKFVKPISNFDTAAIIDCLGFNAKKKVKIKDFSSGMKQKVKIALSVFFEKPILLFDEPCANLDNNSIDWYNEVLKKHALNRTLVICSNQNEYEYAFCKQNLDL